VFAFISLPYLLLAHQYRCRNAFGHHSHTACTSVAQHVQRFSQNLSGVNRVAVNREGKTVKNFLRENVARFLG
jgi:hypothetical protein